MAFDLNIFGMSLPTGIATGFVASSGFFVWLRFRRNVVTTWKEVLTQFTLSTSAASFVAYQSFSNKKSNKEALSRMMFLTEGEHILAATENTLPIMEYDDMGSGQISSKARSLYKD